MAYFEDAGDDDVEIVVMEAGKERPDDDDDKVVMTKAELAALRAQADDRAQLREVTEGFGKALKNAQAPVANQALPAGYKTQEEFDREVEEQFLAKPAETIRKMIQREVQPFVVHAEEQFIGIQRRDISRDEQLGPVMSKYADEIEAELAALPRVERTTRKAYEQVVQRVRMNHFDEIVAERVAAEMTKLSAPAAERSAPKRFAETGRMQGSTEGKAGAKKIYITDALRAEARRNHYGDDVEGYARIKARLEG